MDGELRQHDRRNGQVWLTEEQIEVIAERAAEKAIGKMAEQAYLQVGKTVVGKLLWLVGLVVVGAAYWLDSKGLLKWG